MPPASLSTLAVMKPGPTTAKKMAARVRQFLSVVMRASVAVPQHRDHIVGGDDAGNPAVLVGDGEGEQVVLVEQRRDFVLGRIGGAGAIRLAQLRQLHRWRRDRDLHERHGADQLVTWTSEIDC